MIDTDEDEEQDTPLRGALEGLFDVGVIVTTAVLMVVIVYGVGVVLGW